MIGLHNVCWALGAVPLVLLTVLVVRGRRESLREAVAGSMRSGGTLPGRIR